MYLKRINNPEPVKRADFTPRQDNLTPDFSFNSSRILNDPRIKSLAEKLPEFGTPKANGLTKYLEKTYGPSAATIFGVTCADGRTDLAALRANYQVFELACLNVYAAQLCHPDQDTAEIIFNVLHELNGRKDIGEQKYANWYADGQDSFSQSVENFKYKDQRTPDKAIAHCAPHGLWFQLVASEFGLDSSIVVCHTNNTDPPEHVHNQIVINDEVRNIDNSQVRFNHDPTKAEVYYSHYTLNKTTEIIDWYAYNLIKEKEDPKKIIISDNPEELNDLKLRLKDKIPEILHYARKHPCSETYGTLLSYQFYLSHIQDYGDEKKSSYAPYLEFFNEAEQYLQGKDLSGHRAKVSQIKET